MTTFLKEVKAKISKEINPEAINIIDNSSLHTKHQSFDPQKFHLKLIIKSKKLKQMNKIQAHRLIFEILKNEIKDKIHALEIYIE